MKIGVLKKTEILIYMSNSTTKIVVMTPCIVMKDSLYLCESILRQEIVGFGFILIYVVKIYCDRQMIGSPFKFPSSIRHGVNLNNP